MVQIPSTTRFNHLPQCNWPEPHAEELKTKNEPRAVVTNEKSDDDEHPGQFDIWRAIQAQRVNTPITPYVHPLFRRSSSMLSQESLEICTESLGSETGSNDFSSFLLDELNCIEVEKEQKELEVEYGVENNVDYDDMEPQVKQNTGKVLTSVNYHCSIGRRSPARSFPPPLPSISRRDGPCLQMKPHRRDGRLVVEAVAVPSQNYLHAQREGGRLVLCFIDAVFNDNEKPQNNFVLDDVSEPVKDKFSDELAQDCEDQIIEEVEEDEDEDEDEDEEEVEVVDRGTVVEVKVSTQPQQQHGSMKVHRSSLVINKFVGGMPSNADIDMDQSTYCQTVETKQQKRASATMTTAAAAVVAATTVSVSSSECYSGYSCSSSAAAAAMPQLSGNSVQIEDKLLFTSKLRNRRDLLHNMKRCSQLKRPLFIWEPCCIATTG